MTSTRKHLAHLIPEPEPSFTELANFSIRPLRLAFLMDIGSSLDQLTKIIQYNTSIWGGIYNFCAPTIDSGLSVYWWNALKQYDPDGIVYCFEPTDEMDKKIREEIQPFSIWRWTDDVSKHHDIGLDKYRSIPIKYVLSSLYEKIRPIEKSRIKVPENRSDSPYFICGASQFGVVENDYHLLLQDVFKADTVPLKDKTLGEYLDSCFSFADNISPLKVTRHMLAPHTGFRSNLILGSIFVLFGNEKLIEDFCVFWNWRANDNTFPVGIREVIALPYNTFSISDSFSTLGNWITDHIQSTNLITIASKSVCYNDLQDFRKNLIENLPEGFLVDLWYDQFRFVDYRAVGENVTNEVKMSGRKISFSLPSPGFIHNNMSGVSWVVDIQIASNSLVGPGKGYLPPKFPGLDYLLSGEPDRQFWDYTFPE